MTIRFLLLHLLFTLLATAAAAAAAATTLPGCPTHCGNLTIPFPFGTQPGCHLPGFLLTCNTTFSPPRTFISTGNIQLTSLSLTASTATILTLIARDCYTPLALAPNIPTIWLDITGLPYAISNTRNKFTALGCGTLALNYRKGQSDLYYTTGCVSFCNELSSVINGTCSGIGCCQTAIPRGLQRIETILQIVKNHSNTWSFSPCSYAFLVDQDQYVFKVSDLEDFYLRDRVPAVLDWAVGNNETCEAAATSSASYLCGANTYCSNSTNAAGYRCGCLSGYDGNPYLANGCQDINECEDADTNPCSDICENTKGSFVCSCPHGYTGDGKKSGSGCNKQTTKFPFVQVVAGCGLGLLLLLLAFFILYYLLKKRRMLHLKEKFFKQNGGLLLQQQLSAHEGLAETARIFTAEELKRATDNYAESRILGHGGNGTVYKGILHDTGRVVAIKKSHFVEAMQIEQFINEVVLLSQVIHKNVVRILGCCLETQVPLLVYEYVPNGTLDSHLHGRVGSLPWVERLRVAGETAGALAYLHSAIARPIFHRDVKAANILLDNNCRNLVSDFGASRLIPLDRAQITTLVIGTLGYLDPEYFHTGQLTEKSDVYSFGVILAEMITGQKPLSSERPQTEMNLAIYFLLKMNEGKLQEILEQRVKNEGKREHVEAIAELARRCLKLKGEERPTMREVSAEIERVRRPVNNNVRVTAASLSAAAAEEEGEEEEHRLLRGVESNERMEELSQSTRFYSSRFTRVLSSETESATETRYFPASATGDESLDQHILWSLEMQR